MANKKLFAVGMVLAMLFAAGCSSNKSADSGNTAGTGAGGESGSTATGAYDANANGAGESSSDFAQAGRTVYFGYDQSTLSSEAQSILDSNIAKLKNDSKHIRLEGHTDERGTREYNLALGERRAEAVAQYMVANGIAKNRIETISYGKERPADPGHDETAWAKNRRVEVLYN